MEEIDLNKLLERESFVEVIKHVLQDFEKNKNNMDCKKGIYIYGGSGVGKTQFILRLLKKLDYDVIKYDAGDVRNKSVIDLLTKDNMSNQNIINMFYKKVKRIVVVMDEIDGMNNGDKGGINSLIKLIRPKKTKKHKLEESAVCPIICIGNYHVDKKIKDLMKVCMNIELKTPTYSQMSNIIDHLFLQTNEISGQKKESLIHFVQGDLRKLNHLHKIFKVSTNENKIESLFFFLNILQKKSYNDDTKNITKLLINQPYDLKDHLTLMNETDRTIVALLFHENVVDCFKNIPCQVSIPLYEQLLENMCFSDYIDRITFQKQIWQFNEMTSLLKTFKNNKILHSNSGIKKVEEVRFTKVLTKYSTEFNNANFIQNMCYHLEMDKKDLFGLFRELKCLYTENEIFPLFEKLDIHKLDINRMYKYMNTSLKEKDKDEEFEDDDENVVDEDI